MIMSVEEFDGMNIITLDYGYDTTYISIEQSLRQNGYRHYCNGMQYLEQGLTQYALGSFVKAQRNYDRTEGLNLYKIAIDCINNRLQEWSKHIAESIING